jgi:hypothetical protein
MLAKPNSILIVGGGTAGWMAANSFLQTWPDVKVTLIESADIGIIGVGEGATPYLKQYFRQLNISEQEWMPACDATYKVGINFENWSGVADVNRYFHPFFSVLDKSPAELFFYNCGLRRRGYDAPAHPDDYFVAAELARQGLNPKSASSQALDIDYAYHFDSVKLGQFLRDKAKQKGLVHIVDHVTDVQLNESGAINSVIAQQHGFLHADLFVDCTGFSGLLINKALKRTYLSYADNLFNNAAVAIQTPYSPGDKFIPQTRSVALKNGWMWNIPLKSRQGNGYVFCDGYISANQAETELRQTLNIDDNADIQVRHLKMRVGRLDEHWHRNCLAVGLSQGFIEPLEATALMLTQMTVESFISRFDNKDSDDESAPNEFNKELNQVFDGIRDYIVAHYQLTQRQDTDYWQDNRHNQHVPETFAAIVNAWDTGDDVEQTLNQHQSALVYLRPSWYCILAGMGRFPSELKHTVQAANVSEARNYCYTTAKRYFSI